MKNIFALAATSLVMMTTFDAMAQEVRSPSYVYAGPTVGAALNQGALSLGALVGYQFNQYVRGEADFDHVVSFQPYSSNYLTGNAIVQYPISGLRLTPYALAGLGYQWQNGLNQGVWNVGGGARTALTPNADLDLRYRYIQGMTNQTNENVVTMSTTIRF